MAALSFRQRQVRGRFNDTILGKVIRLGLHEEIRRWEETKARKARRQSTPLKVKRFFRGEVQVRRGWIPFTLTVIGNFDGDRLYHGRL